MENKIKWFLIFIPLLTYSEPVKIDLSVIDKEFRSRIENVAGIKIDNAAEFFENLVTIVERNDSTRFSELVNYPITIILSGKKIKLKTSKQFLFRYSKIVNDNVKNAVQNQKFESLFVNSKGAMFGNGQIWFASVCEDSNCKESKVKIIAINQ
jgi:hypothetical protein